MKKKKNIIFDVGDVLIHYRWKEMLMDYGLTERISSYVIQQANALNQSIRIRMS